MVTICANTGETDIFTHRDKNVNEINIEINGITPSNIIALYPRNDLLF